MPVHGTQFAFFVRPFVPDADAVLLEVSDIGVATQEPQEFVDDRSQVDLLGRDERETFRKIKSELMAKTAEGAGASPVRPGGAIFKDVSHQVEIRLHGDRLYHRPSGLARLDGR